MGYTKSALNSVAKPPNPSLPFLRANYAWVYDDWVQILVIKYMNFPWAIAHNAAIAAACPRSRPLFPPSDPRDHWKMTKVDFPRSWLSDRDHARKYGVLQYDGEKEDILSCGFILVVLLAAYLQFHDANLIVMYKKITKGDFKCPEYFPSVATKLLSRILDPNPFSRITLAKPMNNNWFKKGFKQIDKPPILEQEQDKSPCSVFNIVDDSDVESSSGHKEQSSSTMKPTCLNAFDIISLSPAFDLCSLFEKDKSCRSDARFTTQNSASTIVSRLQEVASMRSFKVKKKNRTVKMQRSKEGRKGKLAIDAEIFEITLAFHVVEVKKKSGGTAEYRKFCDQGLKPSLNDRVWTWKGNEQ
ncbi:CBL-interacting protein kinase 18 [Capsicum annuum]|nr:CBL-interacting protein kinase 18 [Capsicum annuum]